MLRLFRPALCRVKIFIVLFLGAFIWACGSSEEASTEKSSQRLTIATATSGGTYHAVGVAVATLLGFRLESKHGIMAAAVNSAGSGENIKLLKDKKTELAIVSALFGSMAYTGAGRYQNQPVKEIRSITMLWENVEHFVLLKRLAKTGNIDDLRSLKQPFSIGKKGSGTEGAGRTILNALEIPVDSGLNLAHLGYTPSANAIIKGRIAGANLGAGPPVVAVTSLFSKLGANRIAILNFSEEQLEQISQAYPVWNMYTIPANTYAGQDEPVQTIAQPNFLACIPDLPEETVYLLTKTIYENLAYLNNIHKATLGMSMKKAILGLPIPLHPGAIKYYKEQGISIPKRLMK